MNIVRCDGDRSGHSSAAVIPTARHVSFPFDFGKKCLFIHLLSFSQKPGEKHASAIT